MKWWKVILAAAGGGLAGTVGSWSHDVFSGVHHPFTLGTILAPIVPSVIAALAALFAKPPNQP